MIIRKGQQRWCVNWLPDRINSEAAKDRIDQPPCPGCARTMWGTWLSWRWE